MKINLEVVDGAKYRPGLVEYEKIDSATKEFSSKPQANATQEATTNSEYSKGQLISKCCIGVFILFQKTN